MNRALVVGEYRLFRGADGHYYAESVFGYQFWTRYLDVFDQVAVVARVENRENTCGMLRVDGDGVSVIEMPYYVGVRGYLRARSSLRAAAQRVANLDGHIILRLPGAVGGLVAAALPRGRAYAVELVGDPADVLGRAGLDHPARRILRLKAVRDLRRQCRNARAVAYVSRYQLEERYPGAKGAATFAYSSVSMPEAAFADAPRVYAAPLRRLIGVGSMEQTYKGFDVLVKALSILRREHPDLALTLVGDGRRRADVEREIFKAGVDDAVSLRGSLATAEEVRAELDANDLFVSSSRTEGLPRTVIEAQARGLAVVGTQVGGTPELLAPNDMCPANDVEALAALIKGYLDAPLKATSNAKQGWAGARRYSQNRMQAERNAMFMVLRESADG